MVASVRVQRATHDLSMSAPKIGMRVRPVFRILGKEGERGIIYYGTKFAPIIDPGCAEPKEK